MNLISTIVWIVKIHALFLIFEHESRGDEVVEKFYWTPKNDVRNIQWEFFVIGKRVPWSVAKVLCSPRDSVERSNDESLEPEDTLSYANLSTIRSNMEVTAESRLAVLEGDDAKIWLSRMLSESDYRYDGLWIGGHRTNSSANWTWIGGNDREEEEVAIPSSPILGNYPEWYKSNDHRDIEKNCLIFDKVGHDLPILVPSNCQLPKPFICSRVVRKKVPAIIVEGIGVYVDGYRYTVYSINEDGDKEEIDNLENTFGVRKLNGGGLNWRDARIECRKRGQYLATVLSNEAATGIASIMLKNRPSMESVWLGGWSLDGTEWTWSPTGLVLSSKKSTISQYPPWLAGHPVTSSNLDEYYQRRGRCLVLDRHLCPYHISPVFLDLDCEKKRPFVCQDGLPERPSLGNRGPPVNRSIAVGNRILEFSVDRMTWNEGREHCANHFGRIASIFDSTTLSAVLDKMTDLYLDHVWVGGRTEKTREGWRWFDAMGKPLSRKGIGVGSSWCLSEDEGSWPKVDADSCLNLDREGHGLPLFYGLQCDFAKQHVLCSIDHGSRSLSPSENSDVKKGEANSDKNEEGKFVFSGRRSFRSEFEIQRKPAEEDNEWTIMQTEVPDKNQSAWSFDDFNEVVSSTERQFEVLETISSRNDKNDFKFFEDYKISNELSTNETEERKGSKTGIRIADLVKDSKKLLAARGYNFTNNDLLLGLEMELVDLTENSTIVAVSYKISEIMELSSLLVERIGSLTSYKRSGMLYVLDDSPSVLDAWFTEQMKLVAIILRNLFPVSPEHPMGLLTFSQSSRLALALNQTNHCSILSYLAGQIISNRGAHRDPKVNNHDAVRGPTDLIKATVAAIDIVRNSGLPRVAVMLVTDGEHTIASVHNEREQEVVVEKLNSLRNSGHEAFAIFVGQSLRTSGSYSKIQELFGDSLDGKRNLYFVNSFSQLGELVSIINSTTSKTNNESQCDHPHWFVSKEDTLLTHLMQKT